MYTEFEKLKKEIDEIDWLQYENEYGGTGENLKDLFTGISS